MLQKIVLATQNPGKINDITQIFKIFNFNFEIIIPEGIDSPEENGDSFYENALIKARAYAEYYDLPALADDSGLKIKCLNDFPGIHTREFADEQGSYANAFLKLEQLLKNHPAPYEASFTSAVVYYNPKNEKIIFSEADLKGIIDFKDKNNLSGNGFGFCPIFIAEGYGKPLSQLPIEEYFKINHRQKSLQKLLEQIQNSDI